MMKTEQDAIHYIHSRTRFGSQKSLIRIKKLLARLQNPQDSLRFIHVAGTNGKGSISTMISGVLTESGYRTGLYTSPYLVDFKERFRINGVMMDSSSPVRHTNRVKAAADNLEKEEGLVCTEFEIVTAIAFCWFLAEQCELVVLEVGLGGRLDSTNAIRSPLCAVIGPISLDHTAILGNTIAEVAAEKAGIIKPGSDVVCAMGQESAALSVIEQACTTQGAVLHFADKAQLCNVSTNIDGTVFQYKGKPYCTPMIGEHQAENAACALETVKILRSKGLILPEEAVRRGLGCAKIRGRLDVAAQDPVMIVDGAHNPAAAGVLKRALRIFGQRPRVAVMAVMQDKDYYSVVHTIAGCCDALVCCAVPDMPRSCTAEEICQAGKEVCKHCETADTVSEALLRARTLAGKNGLVVVCGSLYLAGIVCGEMK